MDNRTHRLRALWVAAALSILGAGARASAQDDVVLLWLARFSAMKGNATCSYGASACNRCVHNVAAQFSQMTGNGAMDRRTSDWMYLPLATYPPKGTLASTTFDYLAVTAEDLLVDGQTFASIGRDYGHFQSFVRIPTTSNGQIAYLTTFNGKNGSLLGIKADLSDSSHIPPGRVRNEQLTYMDAAQTLHIGGMQGIGRKAVVAQELPNGGAVTVSFYDFATNAGQVVHKTLPNQTAAANIAVAQLAGGGYVLISTVDSHLPRYKFYYTPSLDAPQLEEMYVQEVESPHAPSRAGTWAGFENISLITECGTGDIYMVGATGPDLFAGVAIQDAVYPFIDAGYASAAGTWALYKLSASPPLQANPSTYVAVNNVDMDRASCDPRAAGSAFAGQYGELAFYCTTVAKASSLREAGCAAAVAAAGGGGFLAGVINGLSALTGGLIPPFGDVVAGVLTAATTFVAALDCGGPTIGALGVSGDSRWATAYTEFWPKARTAETPTYATYPLTINLTTTGDSELELTVSELEWKHTCKALVPLGQTRTCTVDIPANTPIALLPYGHEPEAIYTWTGGLCDSKNTLNGANACTVVMNGPKSVTLNGYHFHLD